jgi:FkbM family methyltransferase
MIKSLIPNSTKQEVKYFLYDLLKIPYNRSEVPLEIVKWLPANREITFIDIGASVGNFSHNLCGHYQIKKGLLIEPLGKWTSVLEERFADRNKFQIINCALSDKEGLINFYVSEEFDSISSVFELNGQIQSLASMNIKKPILITVNSKTLDNITHEHHLTKIDLIKIDVQGAEHLVLNGGKNTLKNTRFVYTEFSFKPIYDGSSTFFDLYKIFYENNFHLVNISPGFENTNGELLQGDALFVNDAL